MAGCGCDCSGGMSRLSTWVIPRSSCRLCYHSSRQEAGATERTSVQESALLCAASDEAVLQVSWAWRHVAYRPSHGLPVRRHITHELTCILISFALLSRKVTFCGESEDLCLLRRLYTGLLLLLFIYYAEAAYNNTSQ